MADHLKVVEAFRPNVFEALCDSVASDGNKMKRMKKSVDRTLRFLDETLALRSASKVMQCKMCRCCYQNYLPCLPIHTHLMTN